MTPSILITLVMIHGELDFSISSLDAALSIKQGPGVKLYGSLIENHAADTAADGLIYGVKFGSAKKAGQWEASIEYRELEANSVYDATVTRTSVLMVLVRMQDSITTVLTLKALFSRLSTTCTIMCSWALLGSVLENNDADGSAENPNENAAFKQTSYSSSRTN